MEKNSLGRLLGVLTSPKATFRAIADRPTWVVALVVFILVAAGVNWVAIERMDFTEQMREMEERGGGQALEEDQLRTIALVFGTAGSAVFYPAFLALAALLFLVALRVAGGESDFVASFSTLLHGLVPSALLYQLLTLPVLMSRTSVTEGELQRGLLTSNLGALAPDDAAPALVSVLISLDVFSLWSLALLAIGYQLTAKVSRLAAAGTAIGLWAAYVAVKTGFLTFSGAL